MRISVTFLTILILLSTGNPSFADCGAGTHYLIEIDVKSCERKEFDLLDFIGHRRGPAMLAKMSAERRKKLEGEGGGVIVGGIVTPQSSTCIDQSSTGKKLPEKGLPDKFFWGTHESCQEIASHRRQFITSAPCWEHPEDHGELSKWWPIYDPTQYIGLGPDHKWCKPLAVGESCRRGIVHIDKKQYFELCDGTLEEQK